MFDAMKLASNMGHPVLNPVGTLTLQDAGWLGVFGVELGDLDFAGEA
jgi:hypothetical protein